MSSSIIPGKSRTVPLPSARPKPVVEPPTANGLLRLRTERPGAGAVVVIVSGELDMSTAPRLAELLAHRLRGTPASLVVDVSGLTFLGVAGLNVLARTALQSTMRGVELRVVTGENRPVLRILEITGLAGQLPLATHRDQ